MNWQFINTGFNTGQFNMDFDLNLVREFGSESPVLRAYRWEPYCISLGANQDYSSLNMNKVSENGYDVVKRPTGGRAILHAEELTYSVVYPVTEEISPKQIYFEINLALKKSLVHYNPLFEKIELEHTQPHFPSFYKDAKSTLCFAVSAKNELNFNGKKIVGSAQRKMGNVILQHGSILCGNFHKQIIDYLNLTSEQLEEIQTEMDKTTTEIETVLDEPVNYERLVSSIKTGFENHFKIKFDDVVVEEIQEKVN